MASVHNFHQWGQTIVSWHPLPAALYFAGVLLLAMTFLHPFYLLVAVLAMWGLWWLVAGGAHQRRALRGYLLFALLVMVANPLFSHRGATILGYLFDQPITLEAVAYGVLMAGSLLAVLFACQALNLILPGEKLLFLLGGVLPQAALVLQVAVGAVPQLLRRWQSLRTVQNSQGFTQGDGRLRTRAANAMQQTTILLAWSLEQAIVTARSMRARGYRGGRRRTRHRSYHLGREDWLSVVWLVTAAGSLIALKAAGYAQFDLYPRLTAWAHWWPASTPQLATWGLFCLYLATPLYRVGKAVWAWSRWRSRTSRFAIPGPLLRP